MALPVREGFSWPEGKRVALSLTFDDGRSSQVEYGIPILEAAGVKATFYVTPANCVRHLPAWRETARNHEIGNHTVNHPCSVNFGFARHNALEEYTLERMEAELTDANTRIQDDLGVTPATFAYPCGQTFVGRGEGARSYVPLVAKHFLAGRGFWEPYHNAPGYCDLAQVRGASFDATPFHTLKEQIESAAADGGWLVLVGHDVGAVGPRQTVIDAVLREICAYATDPANGVWVDTVEAIASYVQVQRSTAMT